MYIYHCRRVLPWLVEVLDKCVAFGALGLGLGRLTSIEERWVLLINAAPVEKDTQVIKVLAPLLCVFCEARTHARTHQPK